MQVNKPSESGLPWGRIRSGAECICMREILCACSNLFQVSRSDRAAEAFVSSGRRRIGAILEMSSIQH